MTDLAELEAIANTALLLDSARQSGIKLVIINCRDPDFLGAMPEFLYYQSKCHSVLFAGSEACSIKKLARHAVLQAFPDAKLFTISNNGHIYISRRFPLDSGVYEYTEEDWKVLKYYYVNHDAKMVYIRDSYIRRTDNEYIGKSSNPNTKLVASIFLPDTEGYSIKDFTLK